MHALTHVLVAGAIAAGLTVAPAAAQVQPTPPPPVPPTAPPEEPVFDFDAAPALDQWIVTGFIGSDFGDRAEQANLSFGGALSYLRDGAFGAELLAGFSPGFQLTGDIAGETAINNYMVNLMGALPVGPDARWQPFVSAGLGAMTFRTEAIANGDLDARLAPDGSQFAGNLGAGLMGFQEQWGFRADIRYFTGIGNGGDPPLVNDGPAAFDAANVGFWRGNVGLSFRW